VKYLCILFLLAFSQSAVADADIRPIEIDGKPFVAFDRESAQKLLQMRIDFPLQELKLQKLAELVTNYSQELVLSDRALSIANEQNTTLLESNSNLQDRINSLDSWWRSPWLWVCVGIVVGTATTIAVTYAVN